MLKGRRVISGISVPKPGPADQKWSAVGKLYRLADTDLHVLLRDDGSALIQQTEDPKGEIRTRHFDSLMVLLNHLWAKTKDEERGA